MASDWFSGGADGARVDVSALLDPIALDALVQVLNVGALVSLGASRDGGAVGVTVTFDGRWRRDWFRDPESLAVWLTGAAEFLSTQERESASAGQDRGNGAREGRRRR